MTEGQGTLFPGPRAAARKTLINRILERPQFGSLPDPRKNEIGGFHSDPQDTELAGAVLAYPKTGAQNEATLNALLDVYPEGLTDWQLTDRLHVLRTSAGRSRNTLVAQRWVEDSGERREERYSADNIVWRLTEEGARRWRQYRNDNPPA